MNDLEMTKLCAEAMGLKYFAESPKTASVLLGDDRKRAEGVYQPLYDDAQAMALDDLILAHGTYEIKPSAFLFYAGVNGHPDDWQFKADMTKRENRRRARVECVAKMQAAQQDKP